MATPKSLPLQDRVAIVTGLSRGIGKAIAIHLASLSAKLVVNYIYNKEQAQAVADEINSSWNVSDMNPRAIVVQGDVSEPSHVKLLFDEAERVFGSEVHVLVNNATVVSPSCPIVDTDVDEFDRTFRGTFLCCKEGAKRVKKGGGGRIITLSTIGASQSPPTYATYTTTKAAIETMTKILAKELKGTSITANCVAPGPVETDMFLSIKTEELERNLIEQCPFGRFGELKDVVPVVGFLASDDSEWVNGQVIGVAGGLY